MNNKFILVYKVEKINLIINKAKFLFHIDKKAAAMPAAA